MDIGGGIADCNLLCRKEGIMRLAESGMGLVFSASHSLRVLTALRALPVNEKKVFAAMGDDEFDSSMLQYIFNLYNVNNLVVSDIEWKTFLGSARAAVSGGFSLPSWWPYAAGGVGLLVVVLLLTRKR